MPNSLIWSTQETINESERVKHWRTWSELYFTFRSRLPVPPLLFGLFFGKPVAVDHWAGFCLENSCGRTGASPGGRMAREGSLLRRTWRGISVEGWGRGWGGKGRLEITVCEITAMPNTQTPGTFFISVLHCNTTAQLTHGWFYVSSDVKAMLYHMAEPTILRNPAEWSESCGVTLDFPKRPYGFVFLIFFFYSISFSSIHNYANCWATTCRGLVHRCSEHMLALSFHLIAENSLHGGLVTSSALLWLVCRIMWNNK